MADPRPIIAEAQTLIQSFEKCRLKPYQGAADKADTWTVGWGHKMGPADGRMQAGITQKQADDLFAVDLAKHSSHIQEDIGPHVFLDDFKYGMFASFCYNVGPRALLIAPSVVRPAKEGNLDEGILNLYKFSNDERNKYEDGLFYRRLVEMMLGLTKKLVDKPEDCEEAKTLILDLAGYGDCLEMETFFNTHHQKEHCHVCQNPAKPISHVPARSAPKPGTGKPNNKRK